MEGDTFEMEDQRNWTDASYKTYVRPLALPWPYTLAKGSSLEQSVTLRVTGSPPARAKGDAAIRVALGDEIGPSPALGLGLDPDDAPAVLRDAARFRAPRRCASRLSLRPPARPRSRDASPLPSRSRARSAPTPWLEAVIAEVDGFEAEIAALGRAAADLGSPFPVVLVSPASDLKCTLPGSAWPPCPPRAAVVSRGAASVSRRAARRRHVQLFHRAQSQAPAAGRTRLRQLHHLRAGACRRRPLGRRKAWNRCRISRAACAPSSAKRRSRSAPAPSACATIPMAQQTAPNPDNMRQAMNRNDPRQRGLLGAAWSARLFRAFRRVAARGRSRSAARSARSDWRMRRRRSRSRGSTSTAVSTRPFMSCAASLGLGGAPMRSVEISAPREIQAFAAGGELWIANLTGEPRRVRVEAAGAAQAAWLDADSFVAAAQGDDALDKLQRPFTGGELELAAYACARLRSA